MPKAAAKKTIAVDVDDVIVGEAEFIVEYSNRHWGHNLSLDDYREHWAEMWGVEQDEVERRADILHSPEIINNYRILEDAQGVLKKLSGRFELVILTSRRLMVREDTLKWLADNFAGIFKEVHFTGFWDDPFGQDRHLLTKAELSRQIGADYLIDDQPKHCFSAAEAGIESILFGDYAASRELKLPPRVTRCKNWQEVLEYFDGAAK